MILPGSVCADNRWTRVLLLSCILPLVLSLGGCRKDQEDDFRAFEKEVAVGQLTDLVKSDDPTARGRAEAALSELENAVCDAKPILLHAGLGADDSDEALLRITCFDEDQDLRGLSIKECHLDPNGATRIVEERYPVFVTYLTTPLLPALMFTVQIRDRGEVKDDKAWQDFMILALDEYVRLVAEGQNVRNMTASSTVPEVTMPPIWVSIPEPNRVRVWVSAYDRAGHESESFEITIPSWELPGLKRAAARQGL